MLTPQYSGKRSEKIWKLINNLPEKKSNKLYSCFVLLQNMEEDCVKWLNETIKEE